MVWCRTRPSTRSRGASRWTLPALLLAALSSSFAPCSDTATAAASRPGVAVLLVDTDRVTGEVDERIYGHFLEHINHSVVDGLFAEQIRGRGFEGEDFETYWESSAEGGSVAVASVQFENGEKSLRLEASGGTARIRQGRIALQEGRAYDGSVWLKPERGSLRLRLLVRDSGGDLIAQAPLATSGSDWREVSYSFPSPTTDDGASVEVAAEGDGAVLLDHLSLMRADARENGMLRPDLVQALRELRPPFIRWPGGSFASIYRWKDGIGPQVSRRYHPNEIWGGYSDYYGFGTDEFMELCRQLDTEPLVVLAATSIDPDEVDYAMDWVRYLNDPPTTEWGRMRAANGHPEPYGVRYFQIDNEPMNHGLTPEEYAEIVNVYGRRLRALAPQARIVACGQKRSNDMVWSQKVIDIAGDHFDILGVHNYEYEPENFQTGLRRIQDYLVKLRDEVRSSQHPEIKIAVLEWNLSRTYDWRAGLHAAGSLILYERLSPELEMSCPALLMRNTADDPTWTAFIYHDHVSWFPGSGYVVEKLFHDHYAERRFASTTGTFRDIDNRSEFFDDISRMKPEDWTPGTVDAIATGSADGTRMVVKAVNYDASRHTLLARLQGSAVPERADVTIHTIAAGLTDAASLQEPDRIQPVERTLPYSRDLTIDLEPYTVAVVEISANSGSVVQ
jgi:alpha-N-arabinofuranosidase